MVQFAARAFLRIVARISSILSASGECVVKINTQRNGFRHRIEHMIGKLID